MMDRGTRIGTQCVEVSLPESARAGGDLSQGIAALEELISHLQAALNDLKAMHAGAVGVVPVPPDEPRIDAWTTKQIVTTVRGSLLTRAVSEIHTSVGSARVYIQDPMNIRFEDGRAEVKVFGNWEEITVRGIGELAQQEALNWRRDDGTVWLHDQSVLTLPGVDDAPAIEAITPESHPTVWAELTPAIREDAPAAFDGQSEITKAISRLEDAVYDFDDQRDTAIDSCNFADGVFNEISDTNNDIWFTLKDEPEITLDMVIKLKGRFFIAGAQLTPDAMKAIEPTYLRVVAALTEIEDLLHAALIPTPEAPALPPPAMLEIARRFGIQKETASYLWNLGNSKKDEPQ